MFLFVYYVLKWYHKVAPTVLAAISNVTDFLDGIVMPPPLQPSPHQTPPFQPCNIWNICAIYVQCHIIIIYVSLMYLSYVCPIFVKCPPYIWNSISLCSLLDLVSNQSEDLFRAENHNLFRSTAFAKPTIESISPLSVASLHNLHSYCTLEMYLPLLCTSVVHEMCKLNVTLYTLSNYKSLWTKCLHMCTDVHR